MACRCKINPNSVMFFKGSVGSSPTDNQLHELSKNWQKVEYTGEISRVTRSRVMSMLNAWSESIYVHRSETEEKDKTKGKLLRFLTLTISEATYKSDNEVKRKLLMPFIEKLKNKFNVTHYFWRAEAQKNGRIHFHLIIDQFCDKSIINYEWDSCQFNAGILKKEPTKKAGYHSPSTRIESIKEGTSVSAYVAKYALKNEDGRKIEGRIWGCSDSLKEISVPVVNYTNEFAKELQVVLDTVEPKKYETEYLISYSVDLLRHEVAKLTTLSEDLRSYYRNIYRLLYE